MPAEPTPTAPPGDPSPVTSGPKNSRSIRV